MEVLTKDSLYGAGALCAETDDYKVGIAFKDYSSLRNYAEENFLLWHPSRDDVKTTCFGKVVHIRDVSGAIYVDFSNGSRITLFVPGDSDEECIFHKIIYENLISDFAVNYFLRPREWTHFWWDLPQNAYILDADVLTDALTKCSSQREHKIQVLFSDEERFNDFKKGLAWLLTYELIPELHYISDSISDQILYFNNGSILQSRLVGPDLMKKIEKGKLPRFLEKEWDKIIFDSEWHCGVAEDVEDYDLGDLDDLWFG